jgi:hypothetical protein
MSEGFQRMLTGQNFFIVSSINIVMFWYRNFFQTFVCVADTNSLLGYSVLTSLFPTTIFNIYRVTTPIKAKRVPRDM